MRAEVLIATLGTEPGVVTLACDLLLDQGVNLVEVVVVHTAVHQPRIREAVQRLVDEFPNKERYTHRSRSCRLRLVELCDEDGTPIEEPRDEWQTGALYRIMYREILNAKKQARRVHLSVAGGRKSMSVYGMACAQWLFDADDCLWHLLSTLDLEKSRALHRAHPHEAQLIRIPFMRLNTPFATLVAFDDPYAAALAQQEQAERRQHDYVKHFYERDLTAVERLVVRTMMTLYWQGSEEPTSELIGKKTGYVRRSIDNIFSAIYSKLQNYRGSDPNERPTKATLVAFITLHYTRVDQFTE